MLLGTEEFFLSNYKGKKGRPVIFLKVTAMAQSRNSLRIFVTCSLLRNTATSLETGMTKIVYISSLMKAVNAASQALLGQLPAAGFLRGKPVDNGLLC